MVILFHPLRPGQVPSINPHTTEPAPDEWLPGAPVYVPPAFVVADLRIYAAACCSGCKRRGLKVHAEHKGDQYRVVGKCRWCKKRNKF